MIDFHCHLDLYPDPVAVTQSCVNQNLYVLSVTNTPSAWEGTLALSHDARRIRTALGLHPQIAHERHGELPLFEKYLPSTKYVGEIGLDGSPELRPHWETQKRVFHRILELCDQAGGRVMTIHSRRAATQVLDALEARKGAGTPILHWFSGTKKELERAISMGCWFSVGPGMVVGQKGRDLVKMIPRDRLLTESDGPFTQIEGRSVLPWEVDRVVGAIAELWSEDASTVETRVAENLRHLASNRIAS
ncbi:Qat anti-phage system TatD family nuclease QatD [Rhizobium ruizarguesonis]